MKFSTGFYNVYSDSKNMEIFSNLLSLAIIEISSVIHIFNIKDTLENWGVSSKNHDCCYGRYLTYITNKNIKVPFWIGLDITKNDTFVTISFEKVKLNNLLPNNQIADAQCNYPVDNKYCTKGNRYYIEKRLDTIAFNNLCKTQDYRILVDFMNEVFSAL